MIRAVLFFQKFSQVYPFEPQKWAIFDTPKIEPNIQVFIQCGYVEQHTQVSANFVPQFYRYNGFKFLLVSKVPRVMIRFS